MEQEPGGESSPFYHRKHLVTMPPDRDVCLLIRYFVICIDGRVARQNEWLLPGGSPLLCYVISLIISIIWNRGQGYHCRRPAFFQGCLNFVGLRNNHILS